MEYNSLISDGGSSYITFTKEVQVKLFKLLLCMLAIFLSSVLTVPQIFGGPPGMFGGGGGGYGAGGGQGSRGMTPYRSSTVTTIKGEITDVSTVYNPVVREKGLHLRVETSRQEYVIHVCPQWYAEKEDFNFTQGERVTVTGSEFTKDFEQNIYAATIVRGSAPPLQFRDLESGDSLWSGRTGEGLSDEEKEGKTEEEIVEIQEEMRRTRQKEMREKMQRRMRGRMGR